MKRLQKTSRSVKITRLVNKFMFKLPIVDT